MVSTITQRIGGAVDGVPVNVSGGGIVNTTDVAGTNDITASGYPPISAYFPFQKFMVRPFAVNTSSVTLDIDEKGVLPWRKPSGAEHGNGDLSPNIEYLVQLNEAMTEFRTVAPSF
jgi:hypothetical protein